MPPHTAQRRWAILASVILVAAPTASAGATTPAATLLEPVPALTATAASEVSIGSPLNVAGALSQGGVPVAGAPLALEADAYPFRGFATVARTVTAADGSYAFAGPEADRNVRLRVIRGAPAVPSASSATIAVFVDPLPTLRVRSLGPGRTQLTLRLRHTAQGPASASSPAAWFVAAPGTRVFRLLATTPTRELAPGLTYASAIIDPPSKRFLYRVCLNPPWEHAMGRSGGHGHCPRGDYSVGHVVG
jgi:hypothetical protein